MTARIREWIASPRVTPFMARAFVVTVLAVAIAMPLLIIATPYIEFFNDMAVQHKVKPQMVWDVRGGVPVPGDLPAPEGSVSQTRPAWPFPVARVPPRPGEKPEARAARVAAQDAEAARVAAAIDAGGPDVPGAFRPPAATMDTMKRGQKRYDDVCVACHGAYGMGDGRVPPRGFPPPANLLDSRVRAFGDARIFHVVTNGQAAMPSHALQLSPADRWAVIHYVRALQRAFPAPPPIPGEAQP